MWYGDTETNKTVLKYIEEYEAGLEIDSIEACIEPLQGKEREAVIEVRINQGVFRNKLLREYGGKCCLCNLHEKDLLIASHIKPWRACENGEKLSPHNGLLLCPDHDKLFDSGYISFQETGEIMISEALDAKARELLRIAPGKKIVLTEEMKPFMEYHREHVFGRGGPKHTGETEK